MKRLRTIGAVVRALAVAAVLLALLALGSVGGLFFWFARGLPGIEDLRDQPMAQTMRIVDRTGENLLYEFFKDERRTVIAYDKIPQAVKDATVAAEDADFWTHPGLDLRGLARAILRNITTGTLRQGGSTITQQVIKNTILTPERTFARKIREAILAIELERTYTKEQILELYLNQVSYGSSAYGIEAAAKTYFTKSAAGLSLAEAALLAALPKAPSYYSPHGPNADALKARQAYVLTRMAQLGSISPKEAEDAARAPLSFRPPRDAIRAPHFVFWIRELLEERYGPEFIEREGLSVTTSLDWELQRALEDIVKESALANEKRYQAKNAAAVVIDPNSGEVLAMVGSRDYFDEQVDGNVNVALALRQPGSAFKPLTYAVALRKGYRPESIVFDAPTNFAVPPQKPYAPKNYDGRFRGPVTFAEALAQSLNVPAVKVLYLAGINDVINFARDAGVTTLKDRSRFGLSLALGSAEVKLLELTRAYGVFAADGALAPSRPILKVESSRGELVEEFGIRKRRVLDADVARAITQILSDNALRAPVFGRESPLAVPGAAAKTGTTQEYWDAWTVGYTPAVAVGVWAGNNDNAPMTKGGAGVMAAGPIWNKALALASGARPARFQFQIQEKKEPLPKPMVGGYIPAGEAHDILFYTDKDHPADLAGPRFNDPQKPLWEEGVRRWIETNGFGALARFAAPPEEKDAPDTTSATSSAALWE